MSLIKFELKEDHLKLLKHLQWSQTETNHILSISGEDNDDAENVIITPFGGDDLMEDIGLIIHGMPEDFDPFDEGTGFGKPVYTEEQQEKMKVLFHELTTALQVVLYTQGFEAGHYKRKFHDRHWVKYEPK